MSNTIVSGSITIIIGSTPITLTTENISATPKVFSLPAGSPIVVQLADLNAYLNTNFSVPQVTFPGISETSLTISKLDISSAGIFDIAVDFDFGNEQGWDIFPGFILKDVGFEVDYASVPVIDSFTPATGAAGAVITIEGNDLLGAGATGTTVYFGTSPTFVATDANAAATAGGTNTQISVSSPSTLAEGAYYLFVKNADGTSTVSGTTLTIS
jgi:hypothetical protein